MSADDADAGKPPLDVVVGVGVTDDRAGVRVIRLRDATPGEQPADAEPGRVIELGEMRSLPAEHALPAGAELVRLKPRGDGPAWDVDVVVPRNRALSGPPQVATPRYRENWAATFSDDDLN